MPNISKKVVDVAEDVAENVADVVEDAAEKLEDGVEFLMRPEVLACITLLIILICIIMYFMKLEQLIMLHLFKKMR